MLRRNRRCSLCGLPWLLASLQTSASPHFHQRCVRQCRYCAPFSPVPDANTHTACTTLRTSRTGFGVASSPRRLAEKRFTILGSDCSQRKSRQQRKRSSSSILKGRVQAVTKASSGRVVRTTGDEGDEGEEGEEGKTAPGPLCRTDFLGGNTAFFCRAV